MFEYKSRDEQTEVVINEDTIKALEKMINILSKSPDPKLKGQKEKVTLIKKKTEEIILEKLKKQIFDLEMSLQKLITPKPLEPSEMIEVLLYSSDIDSDLSVKDILKMLDKLSGKTPSHNLIYISDSLVNPILKNHITSP